MIARISAPLLRPLFRTASVKAILQRGYAAEGQMPLTFASPYQVYYNAVSVKQLDVPSFSGNFGILPKHVPSLAVIKPGVVTVYEEGGENKKFFVSSGTITINEDSSVQVLAEEAVPIDQLDPQACREGLSKAQQALNSSSEEDKVKAQISVEVHEALVKALE